MIPTKNDFAFKGVDNYYKVHRSKLAQVWGYEWQGEIISHHLPVFINRNSVALGANSALIMNSFVFML